MQYSSLVLDRIMVHQVPKAMRGAAAPEPIRETDVPLVLTNENRSFLTSRLVKFLSGRARPIREKRPHSSEVPTAIQTVFSDPGSLIEGSKTIARELRRSQGGISPSGLLLVADCRIAGSRALVICKVEHEEGMRFEPDHDAAGNAIFDVTKLTDLVFGNSARIYKIAVFPESAVDSTGISGEAFDQQTDLLPAAFFVGEFLGCQLSEQSDVLTRDYLNSLTSGINALSMSSDSKIGLQLAAIADLESQSPTIDVTDFVSRNVAPEFQDQLLAELRHANVPVVPFTKDRTLIETAIRRVRIQTEHGVVVLAPLGDDEAASRITVESGAEGHPERIVIDDQVTSISAATGRN